MSSIWGNQSLTFDKNTLDTVLQTGNTDPTIVVLIGLIAFKQY